jgi:spermidine/putrescine transport system permease protein
LLGISSLVALAVSLSAVLLSYPLAYFLAMYAGRRSGLYLVLLLVPFWTSYLLRVMAWKFMLGTNGVINSFLLYVRLIDEPLQALLYNRNAVMLTLIYVWIPFAALPILAALQRIDPAILEAAADLGAPPARQFLRVTLPLSLPGVFAAFFMVFIPTVGEYVTPLLVGGSSGSLYGNIIQDFFTKAANWPLGSALSMIMLAVTAIMLLIATRLIDLREVLQ